MTHIPFNRPSLIGREVANIRQAVANMHLSGDGPFTKKAAALLEETIGAVRVLLTTSCTHALEMAALLLDIKPGDEVIVPSFTFVSTANAFVLQGATPVFADVRPDTLNLDEQALSQLMSPRTRAVVPVHYAGVACELQAILETAAHHGVAVVEDNAHGLFGKYDGKPLGSFGCLAAQSFHETKNIICGEGGALVVNDSQYLGRAEIIREKGTDRTRFFRGEVDKYTWLDAGSSYVLSDLLAAFLFGQLELWADIQNRRCRIWQQYHQALADWAGAVGASRPAVPANCEQAYHLYYLLLPSAEDRDRLIAALRVEDIQAVSHYVPLNETPMGQRFGGRRGQCPVTEDISGRLVRLPFFIDLKPDEQDRVIEAVCRFR